MDIRGKLIGYKTVPRFSCPAEFWPAFGYSGTARYVAIWWEPVGDEACYSDGRELVVGANWWAYVELVEHNFSPCHPAHWLLGSSETPASCRLVIDRLTEWAWLASPDEAEEVLKQQWPERVVAGAGGAPVDGGDEALSFEQLLALLETLPVKDEEDEEDEPDLEHRMLEEARLNDLFMTVLKSRRSITLQ